MSNQDGQPPLAVNSNPAPDMFAAGLRYILMAAAAVAGALGYTGWAGKFSALLMAVGPVAAAVAFIWGQYSSWRKSKEIAKLVPHVADDVAVFK